jgi:SlyX protein
MTSKPEYGQDHDARLCELEIRLAFSEELLESLNQTVVRQQAEMDAMRRRMDMLQQRLESVHLEDGASPQRTAVEIPPHY